MDAAVVKAAPSFPKPSPYTLSELQTFCVKNNCPSLYDWLGKLMIFEKQLEVYERGFGEDLKY